MKVEWRGILFLCIVHSVSGHYIFSTLLTGSSASSAAIRRPVENAPVKDYTSPGAVCNVGLSSATETVTVSAGSMIGFKLEPGKKIYHKGPAAMYLGRAPGNAADWDGSGPSWFKIAEWGATFNPFAFITEGKDTFTTTIPSSVPSGEYLARIEQWGLHVPRSPEVFVSCAQIKITDGGTGSPSMVSIPGYIPKDDPMLMLDIFWPVPTVYTVPGPAVYSDGNPATTVPKPIEPDPVKPSPPVEPSPTVSPPVEPSSTVPPPVETSPSPIEPDEPDTDEPDPIEPGPEPGPDEPDPINGEVPPQTPPCPERRHKRVQKLSIRHFSRLRRRRRS